MEKGDYRRHTEKISEALNQIETQRYDTEMRQEGVTEVIKLGIAFSGKNVKIWTV